MHDRISGVHRAQCERRAVHHPGQVNNWPADPESQTPTRGGAVGDPLRSMACVSVSRFSTRGDAANVVRWLASAISPFGQVLPIDAEGKYGAPAWNSAI
jgi:hypothetical protein